MTKLTTILSIILLISSTALAHSGGTNSEGCHHDRKNGGYHCHKANEPTAKETREISSEKPEDKSHKKSKEHVASEHTH